VFLSKRRNKKCLREAVANACPSICNPVCNPRGICEDDNTADAVKEVDGIQSCGVFLGKRPGQCKKKNVKKACPSICNPECENIEFCVNNDAAVEGGCATLTDKQCTEPFFHLACPAKCNLKCTCEDRIGMVKVFGTEYGMCEDFTSGKCLLEITKNGKLVTLGDECPKTCGRCFFNFDS
jgi:hypothetical protein